MKVKYLFCALLASAFLGVSCNDQYDDTLLQDRVDGLENRIEKLEEICSQLNTNVASLQSIVNVLNERDYVTSVTPVTKEGETIGYTISFGKNDPVTIYNGIDGNTPVIGVAKYDKDGLYYWTLDGEWLLNEKDEMVRAEGVDGEDGATGATGATGAAGAAGAAGDTPKFQITEDGKWQVSYNNGTSWDTLGQATGATGPQGQPGQAGTQISVTTTENKVTITIGEETYEIPIIKELNLSVIFSETNVTFKRGQQIKVIYTINHCNNTNQHGDFRVEPMSNDLQVAVINHNVEKGCGELLISLSEYAKVGTKKLALLVSDGKSNTGMTTLTVNVEAPELYKSFFIYDENGEKAYGGVVIKSKGDGSCTILSLEECNGKNYNASVSYIENLSPSRTWRMPSTDDWTIIHNNLDQINETISALSGTSIYAKSGTSATEAAYWTSTRGTNINTPDYKIYTGTFNGAISFGSKSANSSDSYLKARGIRDL